MSGAPNQGPGDASGASEVRARYLNSHWIKSLWKPLLLGLAFREALAPFTGHPFDFEIWVRLGVYMQSLMNPYTLLPIVPGLSFAGNTLITSLSYPPLPAFVFGVTYAIFKAVGSPSPYLYYFLLKQPMVLCDVASALLLYEILSLQRDPAVAKKAATLWLLFPFAIVVSAVWGALDPIALVLVLATLYLTMKGRPYVAGTALGLAILYKLMPVIFLPPVLISSTLGRRAKASFAVLSLAIPLAGTLVPIFALNWGFSGIFAAESYQGSLPVFGGMGIFNGLGLLGVRDGVVSQVLSFAWPLAVLFAYALSYWRKLGMTESFLAVSLMFSIFRPTMPEQWAVYPLAFLLLLPSTANRTRFLSLTFLASAFLLVNNFMLVRFFGPVYPPALPWDLYVDGASSFADLRYALLFAISIFFSLDSLAIVFGRQSILHSKLRSLRSLRPKSTVLPLAYLATVSLTGGFLDFTATKMVTDWALALQSSVYLGLSWLSLYHIMLVVVFEATAVMVALFSRRGLQGSLNLLLMLTFLNVASSAFSLVLYRGLEGAPLVSSITIYLASSVYVTEKTFVVFSLTISALGLTLLSEIGAFFSAFPRGVRLISSLVRGSANADSIPAPA